MAAIPVILNGVFTSDTGSVTGVFQGTLAYSDRGPGGGPIIPPDGGDGKPPHIWGGGNEPFPTPPIHIPPGKPSVPPPTIWPPGPGIDTPEHPIVLPPDNPSIPNGTLVTWKAVWTEDKGWFIVGVPNVPHPTPSGG